MLVDALLKLIERANMSKVRKATKVGRPSQDRHIDRAHPARARAWLFLERHPMAFAELR
jgi:hypothetical protein